MNNEFKAKQFKDTTVYTLESATSGGTSAGAIASNSVAIGGVQQRRSKDSIIVQDYEKKIEPTKPRNFVAKNAKMGGAGQHKDKKKAEKQGDVKHKNKQFSIDEDHSTVGMNGNPFGMHSYATAGKNTSRWSGQGRDDSVHETPIEMDPSDPMNPMIYGHGANPATLKYRMMRATGQLKDLTQRAQTASAVEWEMIAKQFDELTMNIEQIRHGIDELAKKRKKGGIGSRGIDAHIGEEVDEGWKLAKEGVAEEWSQKYKSSINCSHPKGFSQKAHCAGKKKHTESMMTMEATCPDCGMCQTHGNLNEIKKGAKDSNGFTKCWPGHHAAGTKKGKNGGQVRNCVPNEGVVEGLLDYTRRQQLIQYLAKKLDWEVNYLELASDPELIKWYKAAQAGKDPMKAEHTDHYIESLCTQLSEKIHANAPVSAYIDDFMKAAKTPNAKGHHQFKNKSAEKIRQMAVAASYSAKNPSKKKK